MDHGGVETEGGRVQKNKCSNLSGEGANLQKGWLNLE